MTVILAFRSRLRAVAAARWVPVEGVKLRCPGGARGTFLESYMTLDEFDPLAPQREAAFFYGLFLRGHSVEALRQDIDVPRSTFEKWMKARDFETNFRASLEKVYAYRKQVLAIFDGLVLHEQNRPRLQ
jgi:hypothetical protein